MNLCKFIVNSLNFHLARVLSVAVRSFRVAVAGYSIAMVLKILLVLLVTICVHFDASQGQSCGTAGECSTEYDAACPDDSSTSLGNCMQSQSSCDAPIQPPANA